MYILNSPLIKLDTVDSNDMRQTAEKFPILPKKEKVLVAKAHKFQFISAELYLAINCLYVMSFIPSQPPWFRT